MKHINELMNFGFNKKCLLIGGGLSVMDINLSKIDRSIYTIACNKATFDTDMIVYYDKDINEYYKQVIH